MERDTRAYSLDYENTARKYLSGSQEDNLLETEKCRESDEKRSKIVDCLYSFDSLLFSSFGEWRVGGLKESISG